MNRTPFLLLFLAAAAAEAPHAQPASVSQSLLQELPRLQLPRGYTCDGSVAIKLADVNGDGYPDVILGDAYSCGAPSARLFLNDGHGKFTEVTATHMPPMVAVTFEIAVGDVDGDGDIDILLGNYVNSNVRLLLNDGRGHFTDATNGRLPYSTYTRGVALVDVDGDGDLDIITTDNFGGGALNLWLNDGKGFFTDATKTHLPPLPQLSLADFAVGDLDGDGHPDLAVGMGAFLLLFNDGTGHFVDRTAGHFPPSPYTLSYPTLGDIDGDGNLDIVAEDYGNGRAHLFRNLGKGLFQDVSATHLPAVLLPAYRYYFVDLDGDGDLDLFVATSLNVGIFDGQEQVLENDGTGHFIEATAKFMHAIPDGGTDMAAVGDIDGDGDLDVLLVDACGGKHPLCYTRVLFNLSRQVYAAAAPQVGQDWTLTLCGSPGSLGVLFFAAAQGHTPIPPLGTFGLSLQGYIALPVGPPLDTQGRSYVRVRMPNDLAVGSSRAIWTQALIVDPTHLDRSRFTNVFGDVLQ